MSSNRDDGPHQQQQRRVSFVDSFDRGVQRRRASVGSMTSLGSYSSTLSEGEGDVLGGSCQSSDPFYRHQPQHHDLHAPGHGPRLNQTSRRTSHRSSCGDSNEGSLNIDVTVADNGTRKTGGSSAHRPQDEAIVDQERFDAEVVSQITDLEEAKRLLRRTRTVSALASRLLAAPDEVTCFEEVTKLFVPLFGVDRCSYALLLDDDHFTIRKVVVKQIEHAARLGVEYQTNDAKIPLKDSAVGHVAQTLQPLYTPRTADSPFAVQRKIHSMGLNTVLTTPILVGGGRFAGAINIGLAKEDALTLHDQLLVKDIAGILGASIYAKRMQLATEASNRVSRELLHSLIPEKVLNKIECFWDVDSEEYQSQASQSRAGRGSAVSSLLSDNADNGMFDDTSDDDSNDEDSDGSDRGNTRKRWNDIKGKLDLVNGLNQGVSTVSSTDIKGKILVVDDSNVSRRLLAKRVERLGHTVVQAKDGLEALHLLRSPDDSPPYDLVLLDFFMPNMDGDAVLMEMNDDETLKNIPVIMISGSEDKKDKGRCIELGASAFLQKPFDPIVLKSRIESCLREAGILSNTVAAPTSSNFTSVTLDMSAMDLGANISKSLYAEDVKNVCIIFTDIVGFSRLAVNLKPLQVMDMVQDLFGRFDELCERFGVFKFETIGDAYLCCTGLYDDEDGDDEDGSEDRVKDSATRALAMAKAMCRVASEVSAPRGRLPDNSLTPKENLQIRAGIHIGNITCGVLGQKMPKFTFFGNAVNLAARMEQASTPGKIRVTKEFYDTVDSKEDKWEPPTVVSVKNMGSVETYLLDPLEHKTKV